MVVLRVWSLEQQGFLGGCQKCTFLGSTFLYQKCSGWGPGDSDAHSGLRTAGVREDLPERVYQDGLMRMNRSLLHRQEYTHSRQRA